MREEWEHLQTKRAQGRTLDDYEKRLEDQYNTLKDEERGKAGVNISGLETTPQNNADELKIIWLREEWEYLQTKRAQGRTLDDYEKRLEDQYIKLIKEESAE